MKVGIYKCEKYDVDLIYKILSENIPKYIDINKVFKSGNKILIKPNLIGIKKPELNITTHPAVIEAIVKYLKNFDVKIGLGDNPGAPLTNFKELFYYTGMTDIMKRYNVKEELFQVYPSTYFEFQNKKIYITGIYKEYDYIINVPKFKTHTITIITCAVKNLFGFIPGMYKLSFHSFFRNSYTFSEALVHLTEILNPKIALNIVDAIEAMEGEGPSGGQTKKMNAIGVGNLVYDIDAVMANLINLKSEVIPFLHYAIKKRIFIETEINLISNEVEKIYDFVLPKRSILEKNLPSWIYKIGLLFLKIKPILKKENCISCFMCEKSCPTNCIIKSNNYPQFNYSKCIQCFCCAEMCPSKAILKKESLVIKIYNYWQNRRLIQ